MTKPQPSTARPPAGAATATAAATAVAPHPVLAGVPQAANEAVFIARQPIFDARKQVIGYELLFRSSGENVYAGDDARASSLQTINRAVHSIGLNTLVGDKQAFFNLPHDMLLDETYTLLPPQSCVVELLESAPKTDEVIAACRKLKADGYRLALDDVVARETVEPLLPLADFVKLDLRSIDPARRRAVLNDFADCRGKLLAEKIETAEEFEEVLSLGCHYAQGYFFCRPEVLKGKGLAGVEAVHLELMAALGKPQLDYRHLESLIKRDVSLSYKLLRYMNSAALGVRNRVTSVQQALVLLGERPLRKWIALVVFTSLSRSKPTELLVTCLVRAHFCETLSRTAKLEDRQLDLFLIGLLSGLDAALDMTMEALLAQMSLPADVRAVLLQQPDAPADLVRIFNLAKACERGAWGAVMQPAMALRLTQGEVAILYYDALGWANQFYLEAA